MAKSSKSRSGPSAASQAKVPGTQAESPNTHISDRDIVQSLERGMAVLRSFNRERSSQTLDEVAASSGLSRSAARRLLLTLADSGLIFYDGKLFSPAPHLLDLGYAQQAMLSLSDVAEPHCRELSAKLGRIVSLARLEGANVHYLLRIGVPRSLHLTLTAGGQIPAYIPMVGRIQLAELPSEQVAQLLSTREAQDYLSSTPSAGASYVSELHLAKERGWCAGQGVLEDGLAAIAVPVRDHIGNVVSGLSVTTHTDRPREELAAALPSLLDTAERIRADLFPPHLP